ncbi:cytochrome c551 [Sporosarcina limicola]|uniref:Cytochrome c551 n=1 Tax=Sporosarcina limicola TaxID=34101 RepID=A0A927R4L6_9BACL|nr:cytochrome c [Sporosarcina limicola]MBE1555033.1 cytochrome c551 [Sporosarcina limicola]
MKNTFLAILLGAVLVLGACGGEKADKKEDVTTGGEATVDAEKVVQSSCIGCHGGKLEGSMGPALADIGARLSESEIHDIIVNGKGKMQAQKLKDDEATAVAKWLSEKK